MRGALRQLVGTIARQLAGVADVTEGRLVVGRRGTPHEIGIAIESHTGEHPVRIAVDYHAESRATGVDWIDALRAKYRDVAVDHVVAVARLRFTPAARAHAAAHHIRTLVLADACAEDWARVLAGVAGRHHTGGGSPQNTPA